MAFSNEEWVNRYGGDGSFLEIWDALDCFIATNLRSVVSWLSTPASLARSAFAHGDLSV